MNYEIFPWNSHFETGIEVIDQQHRKLVAILNGLALEGLGTDRVRFHQVLGELLDYTHYHFDTEEKIWREHLGEGAQFQGHHQAHELFFKQISDFGDKGEAGALEPLELIQFLTQWLAFHILESDRRMALTVKAVRQGKDISQARCQADDQMSGPVSIMVHALLETYDQLSRNVVALAREKTAREAAEAELRDLKRGLDRR